MSLTVDQFRANFPEFEDTAIFPDAMVTFWLTLGTTLLTPAAARWDTMFDHGVALITAHQLVLADRNRDKAGVITAPKTGSTVDKVTVSYDTSAVTIENAGHWNGTSYGLQFYQLVRMMGAGGMQF